MFNPQDRVAVSIAQLHNKTSVVEKGEVVSILGQTAKVVLDGEDVPRTVSVSSLNRIGDVFGEETGRPNEMPVIDAIRR
jgi:hypothetical protein